MRILHLQAATVIMHQSSFAENGKNPHGDFMRRNLSQTSEEAFAFNSKGGFVKG